MVTVSGLREAGTNLFAALLYLGFAGVHLAGFAATSRPSLLLVVVVETFIAALFLLRAPAERANVTAYAWLTSLGGTLTPLLLRPVAGGHDLPAWQLLQCFGGALTLLALASLRRSFALLPAVRAVRFGGPYRWVRHPIYAGYAVQLVGYVGSNVSVRNLAIVVVAIGFQILRVHEEERLLATVPEYAAYMRRTRWRLLPLVF